MPEVGVFHLIDDGVVLPDDTVEGVVFNHEPSCINVSTAKADALDTRNGVFHPKERVVFPNTGMEERVANEGDSATCINVACRCVNG